MSKAFVKESEAGAGEAALLADVDTLPAGVKNYVTPRGARLLREEYAHLNTFEIPRLKTVLDQPPEQDGHWEAEMISSAKRQLQGAEHRLRLLGRHMAKMEWVDPAQQIQDRVYFGARVSLLENGIPREYHIVGVDEADPESIKISWISPIAVALRGARIGDKRMADLPCGLLRLEVTGIIYTDEP